MVDETKSPTYEEVVAKVKERNVEYNRAEPHPDRPYTAGPTTVEGDSGHVNTALNPAPAWAPAAERIPVPVINDPGLLGNNPDLAVLNRAYRSHDMARVAGREESVGDGPAIDDTAGVTEESNREAIRKAAQDRLDRMKNEKEEAIASPASPSAPADPFVSTSGSKFGSASA